MQGYDFGTENGRRIAPPFLSVEEWKEVEAQGSATHKKRRTNVPR
jgi:hypothetical protein